MPWPKGRKRTKEERLKIGKGNKGKIISEESKNKISEAHKKISNHSGRFKKGHKTNLGKKRSVETIKTLSVSKTGCKNPNWKGGKTINGDGYILIKNNFHPFNNGGYVQEHRLVVEKIIKRFLNENEVVHHINKDKKDNRPQNLIAFHSHSAHMRFEQGGNFENYEIIFDGRNHVNVTSLKA